MERLAFSSQVCEHVISSVYLHDQQTLQVLTPPRYSPLASFPLLIVLDGDDYRQQGRLMTLLQREFQERPESQWITAFLPCSSENRDRWYHPGSQDHILFQRFLTEEAIPYLESEYSTWAMAAGRGILGSSLSGSAALNMVMHYPRSFQIACAQSPFVPETLLESWESTLSEPHPVYCYVSAGLLETDYQMKSGRHFNFLDSSRRLAKTMAPKLWQLEYEELSGGHSWGSWQENLRSVFNFLHQHWSLSRLE